MLETLIWNQIGRGGDYMTYILDAETWLDFLFKGALDNISLIPSIFFFFLSWDFYTIKSVKCIPV